MYSMKFDWKSHPINLSAVDQLLRSIYPAYVGDSADSALTLWFSEEPSEEDKVAIIAYWEGISEASNEAISYRSQSNIQAQIDLLKAGLVNKTWDAMSPIERKLVMGMTFEVAELFS